MGLAAALAAAFWVSVEALDLSNESFDDDDTKCVRHRGAHNQADLKSSDASQYRMRDPCSIPAEAAEVR
jgi:hypothetical protein